MRYWPWDGVDRIVSGLWVLAFWVSRKDTVGLECAIEDLLHSRLVLQRATGSLGLLVKRQAAFRLWWRV